ncbi:hypothetical protein M430DRAFT_63452 [Amorphotheca resinae ATCC 22711]|uniref:Uncharacterized protein n=1 Tax=Amorphotheca resinae ATCC 22711 TaxID=857342 RepID=A0A2T3BFV8_AMORE|nr:hypothetical protein M430DRAFT_63452 [Amorphotheca resinae ATCC 22711]PSS28310.1 hypothetical protein M430DRAFT_63452 [Amorphotheca resinae ATCC 22711]
MRYALASLALAAGASAASIPRSCSFGITATGGEPGTMGQLSDGQNRIGGGLPPASYSISNGAITDSNGRGCILTPEVEQFQCDSGAAPTGGFAISSSGEISHNGSETFYACPASDTEWNIYTTPVVGQKKCVTIGLTASGCYSSSASSSPASSTGSKTTAHPAGPGNGPSGSSPAGPAGPGSSPAGSTPAGPSGPGSSPAGSSPAGPAGPGSSPAGSSPAGPAGPGSSPAGSTPASPAGPASSPAGSSPAGTQPTSAPSTPGGPKSCPANLNGQYQYPHLIVPVSASSPDKSFGTSYNGTITSDISSIFNFDVPKSYTGTCSLVFLFPQKDQLETSSFSFSGNGEVDFAQLTTVATNTTTYATEGSVKTDFGNFTVTPGSSTVVSSFSCPAGQTVSYKISSVSGTSLNYFQDWNPSPIGLFITTC